MLNLILPFVSFYLFCFASLHHVHARHQIDQDLLLSFSLNTSSSTPLNWPSSVDCCLWEGITCDDAGWVTNLSLPSRGLSGVLSPSIWNLTHLSHLNLSHNRLFGPLNIELSSPALISLEALDLSYNLFDGELPPLLPFSHIKIVDLSSNRFYGEIRSTFFQVAEKLTSFNISNNSFTGLIPSSICFNYSLSIEVLDYSYNDFTGQILNGLGKCSQLQVLRAGFNNLSGPIPEDIYEIVALQEISLPVNYLSGNISSSIVNLTKLRILELYSNQLTGSIPQDVGKLYNLEILRLHINELTGSLPASLANCTNLVTLNLRVNFLWGDLSAFDFPRLRKLHILDLGNNNFTGELPDNLYLCSSLIALRLASNQLKGQISPDIHALQSLSFLSLSSNKLTNITGAIKILMGCKNLSTVILSNNSVSEALLSDEIIGQSHGFKNLQVLSVGRCRLIGQIPTWLAFLKKLEVLDLSFNQITGPIPAWLRSLPNLFYIGLSDNQLNGNFPKELAGLPALANQLHYQMNKCYLELPVFVEQNNAFNLQYNRLSSLPPAIYVNNNNLTGKIPAEISNLKLLLALDLSNNNFFGNIPAELSSLTNLEKLDLSGNHLTGEIPSSLQGLYFLSLFSVANNNLQGNIPSKGQFGTFPSSSFMGNPGLCGPILQRPCSGPSGSKQQSNPGIPQESSNETLIYGVVAGLTFGFIVGFAYGLLFPIYKLKLLAKFRFPTSQE